MYDDDDDDDDNSDNDHIYNIYIYIIYIYVISLYIYTFCYDPFPPSTRGSWSLSEGYEASLLELQCDKGILSPSNFSRVTWTPDPAGGTKEDLEVVCRYYDNLMDMVLNTPHLYPFVKNVVDTL